MPGTFCIVILLQYVDLIMSISQMSKPRDREMKKFDSNHTASDWQQKVQARSV